MRLPKLVRRPMPWVVSGAVTLAVALAAVVARHAGEQRWREFEARAATLEAEWNARDLGRAALWGETREGSAFEAYDEAMALARELTPADGDAVRDLWVGRSALTATEIDALFARWAPAIAGVREGAHRRDARLLADATPDLQHRVWQPDLLAGRWVMNLMVLQARELRDAGRGREAVELLLDAATYGHDLVRGGHTITQIMGLAFQAIVTSEAWRDDALTKLDRESLELLRDGIDRLLEGRAVTPIDVDRDLRYCTEWILESRRGSEHDFALSAWAHGFSPHAAMADSYLEAEEVLRAHDEAALDTSAYGTHLRDVGRDLMLVLDGVTSSHQRSLAELRILRSAIALTLGEPDPELADPYGDGPLHVESEQGAWTVTSVGPSGRAIVRTYRQP